MIYIAFLIFTILILLFVLYQWQFFMVFTPLSYQKSPLCEECSLLSAVMSDGVELEGALYEPQNPHATLLVFVGRSHDAVGLINKFARTYPDVRIIAFNYRGYGKSKGSVDEKNIYSDALEIAALVEKNYGSFFTLGFSIGSSVATYLASRKTTSALFLIGAFDSVEALAKRKFPWLPKWLLRYKFPTIEYIKEVSAPTYLFVSRADEIVPIANAQRLKNAVPNLVCYKEFEDLSHKELLWDEEVIQTIQKAMQ